MRRQAEVYPSVNRPDLCKAALSGNPQVHTFGAAQDRQRLGAGGEPLQGVAGVWHLLHGLQGGVRRRRHRHADPGLRQGGRQRPHVHQHHRCHSTARAQKPEM